jgi:signal transduction histidine kinase
LAPLARLRAINRRDYLTAEAEAVSAERAGFRTELATSLLGLAAIALFAIFALRLLRRIETQNLELQLADTAKDEFIGTVSHELRTPLTSMNGYVELLLDESGDPLTEEQRSFLATVQRGSTRLRATRQRSPAHRATPKRASRDAQDERRSRPDHPPCGRKRCKLTPATRRCGYG